MNDVINFVKCCNALETTSVAFKIRERSELQLLNEFYENLITSLALKLIYNRNKFIVDVVSLPG
jgi:hypothetical protein